MRSGNLEDLINKLKKIKDMKKKRISRVEISGKKKI